MARKFEDLTKDWPEERKQKAEQRSKDLIIEDLKRQLAEAQMSAEEAWSEFRKLSVRDGRIVAALEQQLAEARRKAFEEAADIADLMADKYDKSRVNVSQRAIAAWEVAEALREAGKRGLEG